MTLLKLSKNCLIFGFISILKFYLNTSYNIFSKCMLKKKYFMILDIYISRFIEFFQTPIKLRKLSVVFVIWLLNFFFFFFFLIDIVWERVQETIVVFVIFCSYLKICNILERYANSYISSQDKSKTKKKKRKDLLEI